MPIRATVFDFEGIQGHQRRFITWILEQCAPEVDSSDILAPDALDLLAERLITPLQITEKQFKRYFSAPLPVEVLREPAAGAARAAARAAGGGAEGFAMVIDVSLGLDMSGMFPKPSGPSRLRSGWPPDLQRA